MNPSISVVIPAYNAERYARVAIESALGQTYRPLEVICVNDGSADGTAAVLSSFGDAIRVIDCARNGGIAAARNEGLRAARGAYVAFLDADDAWAPNKLETQEAVLRARPDVSIVFSHMRCFLSPDLPEDQKRTRYCPPVPMPGEIAGTALVRADVFARVGPFDPRWKVGEFVDWLARARAAGIVDVTLPDVFLSRRIHATNSGITDRSARGDYVRIVKEALDRKRRQAGV